jgi:dipeptidyl aminopeptidase/acylaminoacyl peptidase
VTLSRDGRRLGILASDEPGSTAGFWTYDQVDTEWRARQSDGDVRSIALSASGDRALLSADAEGAVEIYVRQIGAPRGDRRNQSLRTNAVGCDVTDWSPYGRHIICNRMRDDGSSDLWRLTYDLDLGRFREFAVVESAFDERDGVISPDSRWLAFLSNQTGSHQVYVARFPGGDNAVQISTDGASQPRWGRDLNELYYVSGSDLVSVALQTEPHLAVSAKVVLFSDTGLASDPFSGERHYDADPARGRFLVGSTVLADGGVPATIRIVENWIEEFRRHQE